MVLDRLGIYLYSVRVLKMNNNRRRRAIACAIAYVFIANQEKSKKRSKWAKKLISRRNELSHMLLLKELQQDEPNDFRNYLRMDNDTFRPNYYYFNSNSNKLSWKT